jgi:hypothetical protein
MATEMRRWDDTGYVTLATPSERGVWIAYADTSSDTVFRTGRANIYYGAPAHPGTWPNVYYLPAEQRTVNHEMVKGDFDTQAEAEARVAELRQDRAAGLPT